MRGTAAGALAAAVWFACDPLLKRAFRTPYADSEVLGPFLTRGPLEPAANLVTHAAAGAAFGYTFERLGLRGFDTTLALALQHLQLLVLGQRPLQLLLGALQRVDDQAERVATLGVSRAHRLLDLVFDRCDPTHVMLPIRPPPRMCQCR